MAGEGARGASVARIGGQSFPDVPACPTCSVPVRVTRFAVGPEVEHYDPDASFRDSTWRFRRTTVATMPEAGR